MRLGIDLGGTKIEAAIIDDSGLFVCRERVSTPKEYADILKAIAPAQRDKRLHNSRRQRRPLIDQRRIKLHQRRARENLFIGLFA